MQKVRSNRVLKKFTNYTTRYKGDRMRIFIENISERIELPFENGRHSLNLYNNSILIELSGNEEAKVVCSNKEAVFQGDGEYRVPIVWEKNNNCISSVRTKNGFVKYAFQLDNVKDIGDQDILNLYKFVDQMNANFMIGKNYQISDLYKAIKENKV